MVVDWERASVSGARREWHVRDIDIGQGLDAPADIDMHATAVARAGYRSAGYTHASGRQTL